MREVPVIWANDERTKVVLYKAVPKSLYELAQIYFIHNLSPKIQETLAFPIKAYLKVVQ